MKYIDYDLDIKVFPDGEKRLLDVDEYELHSKIMQYPQDIDFILKENVKILVDWINNGKGPFSQGWTFGMIASSCLKIRNGSDRSFRETSTISVEVFCAVRGLFLAVALSSV